MPEGERPEFEQKPKEVEAPDMPEVEAREAKPERMKLKDWWSVVLSTFAFLVSATGFYLNNLEQSEVVSAALYSLPEVRTEDDRFHLEGKISLAFINSGNQHVAIMSVGITPKELCLDRDDVGPGRSFSIKHLCFKSAKEYGYEIPVGQFVIKPNEIVLKEIELTPQVKRLRAMEHIRKLDLHFSFSLITPSANDLRVSKDIVISSGFTDLPVTIDKGGLREIPPMVIRSRSNNVIKAWWNDRFGAKVPAREED